MARKVVDIPLKRKRKSARHQRAARVRLTCGLCRGTVAPAHYAEHTKRCLKSSRTDRAYFKQTGRWPPKQLTSRTGRVVVKLTCYIPEALRSALKIEAAHRGVSYGELVQEAFDLITSSVKTVKPIRKAG